MSASKPSRRQRLAEWFRSLKQDWGYCKNLTCFKDIPLFQKGECLHCTTKHLIPKFYL